MDQLEERKKTNLKIKWFQVIVNRINTTIIKYVYYKTIVIRFNCNY